MSTITTKTILNVTALLDLTLKGVSVLDDKIKNDRNFDQQVIDALVNNKYTIYKLEDFKDEIPKLSEIDANMAYELLRPIQIRIEKADEIIKYYIGESAMESEDETNEGEEADDDEPSDFIKRIKFSVSDSNMLTSYVTDAQKHCEKFIEFMKERRIEQEKNDDIEWDDDFHSGMLISYSPPFEKCEKLSRESALCQIYVNDLKHFFLEQTQKKRACAILRGNNNISQRQLSNISRDYALLVTNDEDTKSQLDYSTILWIDAKNIESITKSCYKILQKLLTYYITKMNSETTYSCIGKKFGMPWIISNSGRLNLKPPSNSNNRISSLIHSFHWMFSNKSDCMSPINKELDHNVEKSENDIHIWKAVYNWLNHYNNKKWLLILNNVVDPILDTDDLIPKSNWGHIIITTSARISTSKGKVFPVKS